MPSDNPSPPVSGPLGEAPLLRVALADDHQILQNGIVSLLSQTPDMVCVGVAQSGDAALELVRHELPHVLVTDLSMPGLPVLGVLKHLRETMPALRIVVLTMHATPFAMAEAFKAGANAFIAKDDPFSVLISSIRRVWQGESGLHSEALDSTIRTPHITSRERDVLQGLAKGLAGKEISDSLGIGLKTMEMYRTRLLKKFNVDKATELVRMALESGVLRMTPTRRSSPPFTISGGRTGRPS